MDDLSLNQIFCQPCCDVLINGFCHGWDRATCQYKRSRKSLDRTAEDRCWLCIHLAGSDISKQVPNASGNEAYEEVVLGTYRFQRLTDSRGSHRRLLEFQISGKLRIFEVSIQNFTPDAEIIPKSRRSLVEPWTGGEHAAKLAAGWLSECLEHHVSCNKLPISNWRPTRLLEIFGDRVRLVLTAAEPTEAPYATLSHCWGQKAFLVLDSKNLPYFLTGISTIELPLTFQQTIATVRRLGMRYLWIDCYCIIQGNDATAQADWAFESAQMGQVYSNSLLNIGAAHANGPGEGLFATRQQQRRCSFPFKLCSSTGLDVTWYVLTETDTSWSPLQRAFLDLYESPLMKRAWVLQECVLSRRMLSYTQTQLFWQCSESAACEFLPFGRVEDDDEWTGEFSFWALTQHQDLIIISSSEGCRLGVQNDRRNLQERWFNILASYSQTSLSYPDKDIFRAIDGVGKSIAALTGDIYTHGILQKTLPQALLWDPFDYQCGYGNHSGHRNHNSRAPSWHWASYAGSLSFLGAAILYRRLRAPCKGDHMHFYPLAHCFLSSDCGSPTLDTASAIEFWPHLLCIGRLLKVRLQTNNDHQDEERFSVMTPRHVQVQNVFIDDDDSIRTNLNSATALLPLIMDGTTNSQPGIVPSRFKLHTISSILVQWTGKGTFRRVGTCVHLSTDLLEEISKVKPRLIVLK